MLQKLKVWGFRHYYRFISAHSWKGQVGPRNWSALEIPGEAGPIHARMYAGDGSGDKPLIIYLHGGGWIIGDLDTHTPFCHALSDTTGCTVISVDYRLAPEHPFPAAPRDCLAATAWIAEHIGDFGPSNHRLIVAGDSAGANLATCACLQIDPATRATVIGQLLIYPVVDHYTAGFQSYIDKARGQTLTADLMHWFWDTYLDDLGADDPKAVDTMPLRADNLSSLPDTLLVTAENDPLRDEGIAYAEKLREAGVALQYRHFDSAAHGFACSEGPNQDHTALMADIKQWLAQLS